VIIKSIKLKCEATQYVSVFYKCLSELKSNTFVSYHLKKYRKIITIYNENYFVHQNVTQIYYVYKCFILFKKII